jgi:hypothetical protein
MLSANQHGNGSRQISQDHEPRQRSPQSSSAWHVPDWKLGNLLQCGYVTKGHRDATR